MDKILTVSEITSQIKFLLEDNFSEVEIIGEISNFKAHISGHWYFTLKDANSQISCTMWKGLNSYVFFTPKDGMKVIIKGKITVYPPRGNYQLDTRSMKPAGEGELQKAFEELKKKLKAEGLFDDRYKKEIPLFPNKIGIVTGKDAAALKDMLSIARRRFPLMQIIIAPAKVQGEGAANEIANSINLLNKIEDIDLIIIGRGGGSLEDLWAFNEEIVARAIFNSKIPIISAVGHEVDFTISDFVADLRAPTPSAAMELATPDKDEIFAFLSDFKYNLNNNILEILSNLKQKINQSIKSYGYKNFIGNLNIKKQFLDNYLYRIQNDIRNFLLQNKNNLNLIFKTISLNNIDEILKKGFSIVEQNLKIVKRKSELNSKLVFSIKFYDGKVEINNND